MEFLQKNSFIVKHEKVNGKDALSILNDETEVVCQVAYEKSWKMPQVIGNMPVRARVMCADVRLEGKDGKLLCKINEIPTGTFRLVRKWELRDEKETYRGLVVEKPKFIGSDWVLYDAKDNLLAVAEGDQKKHNYAIVSADKGKLKIAVCSVTEGDTYKAEILDCAFDFFLLLSYVIVLDLAKVSYLAKGIRR